VQYIFSAFVVLVLGYIDEQIIEVVLPIILRNLHELVRML